MDNLLVEQVNHIVDTVDTLLIDQMGLTPPDQYDVSKRENRIYLVASFDPTMIGRNLKLYKNPDTLKVIRRALGGLPVVFTEKKRFTYTVLVSGKLKLPRSMNFPGYGERDVFRLGVSLRGEVAPSAKRLGNVQIGSDQGAGKSTILKLLVYQARQSGWKLFICDPDGHTFNPDLWNQIASAPVASSPDDLVELIDKIYSEIADRAILFRQISHAGIPPEDLDAYNKIASTPLPRIGLWIDEANSYLDNKRVYKGLADLLRRGRKWGLHIFLAGHEWHKAVVTPEVSGRLQTRISLKVTDQEAANVVLRSAHWGKWVMGQPTGRGVIRIDQYQPMQFYLITEDMEREWLSGATEPISLLPEAEASLVRRSLAEEEGRFTQALLQVWGMEPWAARTMLERYEARGWVFKDQKRGNGRYISDKLSLLVSNPQTTQTFSNPLILPQTPLKPSQTPEFGAA